MKIGVNEVNHMKKMGFSWTRISEMIGVSERTARRRGHESNLYLDSKTKNSPQNLKQVMREIIEASPNSGERMILGALRARPIYVARWRVGQAIADVDPLASL